MISKGFLISIFLILFVQHMNLERLSAAMENDNKDYDYNNDGSQTEPKKVVKKGHVLGVHAAKVAFHLRDNLLNLVGYLMYQNKIDMYPEMYYYLHEFKMGLKSNHIDIFKIIPILPKLINKTLDKQMDLVLMKVQQENQVEFCNLKCIVHEWGKRSAHVSMLKMFEFVSYNPFLKNIFEENDDLPALKQLIVNLRPSLRMPRRPTMKYLSPLAVKIFQEIKKKKTSLTPELLGYLLPMYPWPLDDYDVSNALSVMSHSLIDERGYLLRCGMKIRKRLATQPIEMLARFMADLVASDCGAKEREAANVLLQTLKYKMPYPNYRKFLKGVYVEIKRLDEIFNIISQEDYPLEIVVARERVKRYVNKIIFYVDYKKFTSYKYKTKEEILIAFINFLLQEAPYPPIAIKQSMSALKAYVLFQTGPQRVTIHLLLAIIDAFLAPDLDDDIIEVFLKIKTVVLDETERIMKIFDSKSKKKCLDLLSCYFQIMLRLQADSYLKEKLSSVETPRCLLSRFMNKPENTSDTTDRPSTSMSIAVLLDIIDYDLFLRDTVLSAKHVKEYIVSTQTQLNIKTQRYYCTKQETLLSGLMFLMKNSKYPSAIRSSMKAVTSSLKYEIYSMKRVTTKTIRLISQAWRAPFTTEEVAVEMTRIDAILQTNEKDIDEKLFIMDASICSNMLACYNGMVRHLNDMDSTFDFQSRREISPDLYTLNVGDVSLMTCALIIEIVSALQSGDEDDSELEAAKAYLEDFDDALDVVIFDVDCTGQQVYPCFEMILDKLRFELEDKTIKVNIIQFILKPSTCDERYCWWLLYEEGGSTILNPLLDYTRYIITYYSVNEAKSFHIQLDVDQINEYLGFTDLEETFDKFKVKVYSNNIEKIERLLELLKEAHLMEDHVSRSVDNVYQYITKNQLPNRLHRGNLIFLKDYLKSKTSNKMVKVELDEIEIKIMKIADKVNEVLKDLYVDCFTMKKCLKKIDEQMNTIAYNRPGSRPIIELLKPDSCRNNRTVCPWILPGLQANKYIPKVVIPLILKRMENKSIDLIERLVWKIVKRSLQDNPDMITIELKPPEGKHPSNKTILINFIEQVLEVDDVAGDLKKYMAQLLSRLRDQNQPVLLDVPILEEVHSMMANVILNEEVIQNIKEMQAVLKQNEQAVDNFIRPITVQCDTLKLCVRNIYDELEKEESSNNIIEALLELYTSSACPQSDCSWQVNPGKKMTVLYQHRLERYLKKILGMDNISFHISLDIQDVLEYIWKEDVIKEINSVVVSNKTSLLNVLHEMMFMLSINDNTPDDITISLNNILDYVNTMQIPVYLHFTNLMRVLKYLKDSTKRNLIKRTLDNGIEFMKSQKDEAKLLLETTPVNCTTVESCLNTLYVRVKHKSNRVGDILLTILKPSVCTIENCPWIPHKLEIKINQIEEALLAELKHLQKNNAISIHIKLDMQIIKRVVRVCTECLEKIPESAMNSSNNELLKYFLKTMDDDLIAVHQILYVKRDLEAYLATEALPKLMDVTTLLIFAELLKRMAKSNIIKAEISQQKIQAEYMFEGIRKIMLDCPLNCLNVRKCVETMEYCLNEKSIRDDPHSILVSRLIRPIRCNRIRCPWLPLKDSKDLRRTLQAIKSEMGTLIRDERVPFIIRVALSTLTKEFEQIEKYKNYLQGISKNNPSKLLALLKFIRKGRKGNVSLIGRVKKMIEYLKSRKMSSFIVTDDLPGITSWLMDMSSGPDIKKYMESTLNMVMRKHEEVDLLLRQCPVTCSEIQSCLQGIGNCLKQSKSNLAVWVVRLLFPTACTKKLCPWIGDGIQNEKLLPIYNPKMIYPDDMIVFYYDNHKALYHVTIQLSNEETQNVLKALTYANKPKQGRQTIFNTKGTSNKRILDYSHIEILSNIGSKAEPKINFTKADSIVVCVPFKNGHVRPLKFDLKKKGIREAFERLSRQQVSLSRRQKPSVTLVDVDDTKTNFIIDALDRNSLRRIFEQTIDDINPRDYKPVFFWPRKTTKEAWKSAVIQEKSPIEVYLRNLPGNDYANEETPVVITSDGIITMDFDINDPGIIANIETAVGNQECILDISKHKKFTFYIPVPFERNMASISINFQKEGTVDTLMEISAKYPVDKTDPTILIEEGKDVITPLQFNFYEDILSYMYHHVYSQQNLPTDRPTLNFVIIPLGENENVVLDLNNAKVRDLLLKQFADMIYKKRLMIIHVPDNLGTTTPIGFDPDDPISSKMLKRLSEKTLTPTKPIFGTTIDGNPIILVIIIDEDFKSLPIVIEDNLKNKKTLESGIVRSLDEEILTLEFSSGPVSVSRSTLVKVSRILPKININGPTYIGTEDFTFQEVVLPLEHNDKLYYATISASDDEVLAFLKHVSDPTHKGASITFTINDAGRMLTIVLPVSNDNVVSKLLKLAARVEIQQRPDTIMIILAPDERSKKLPFILDLTNPKVLQAVKDMEKEINPKSDTKGLYHYVDNNGKHQPIIFDYQNYNYKLLLKLQQETPIELRPIRIANTEDVIPLIAFLIKNEDTDLKEGIILNPADSSVRDSLQYNSNPTAPHTVKLKFPSDDGKIETVYIDKYNKEVMQELIYLSQRTVPFKVPAKPIPLDESCVVPANLKEKGVVDEKLINTRDEKSLSLLMDTEKSLPFTEPQMLVMGPDGKGMVVRMDTRDDQTRPEENTKFSTDSLLVINPEVGRPIVVDVSKSLVSNKLMQLSENNNAAAEMIVFTDHENQVQFIRLDTRNLTIIGELWELQQRTTSANLAPFIVIPNVGSYCWTFTVVDEYGEKKVIILDVTNTEIRNELIKMWDASTEGIPLTIKDYNNNPLTLYLDVTKQDIVRKLTLLTLKTMTFNTPLISGAEVDKKMVLKIPSWDESRKYLINCDISDLDVVDGLLKIPGRSRKGPRGAAFMLKDRDGQLTTMYLDLSSSSVVLDLKKVCPEETITLDPSQTLVVDLKNKKGERMTNVLNLDNPLVLGEMKKWLINMESKFGRQRRALVDVPIAERSGTFTNLKFDMESPEMLSLLEEMTRISLNQRNLETFMISEGKNNPNIIVMFGPSGPLMVDQSNLQLVNSLLVFSTPYNPRATKVTFGNTGDWTKTGYFDVSDPKLMAELKLVVDQHFQKDRIFPPVTLPEKDIVKVPCIDQEGRSVLLYLDVTKYYVIRKLMEQSTFSKENEKYNMKITIVNKGSKQGTYKIDTNNVNTCEGLRYVAHFTFYIPDQGSILIMNVPDKNMPLIFLDLQNAHVLTELVKLSKRTDPIRATHIAIYHKGKTTKTIKLNTKEPSVVQQLIELADYTSIPIAPMTIANPYGRHNAYVAFTARTRDGHRKHILLNMEDPLVTRKLEKIPELDKMVWPLRISFETSSGQEKTYVLDAFDDDIIRYLNDLSKSTHGLMDALLNVPQKHARLEKTLLLPIEESDGLTSIYSIDIKTLLKWRDPDRRMRRNLKTISAGLIVYIANRQGYTTAVRVNTERIFRKHSIARSMAFLDPTQVLVLTLRNIDGSAEVLILNSMSKQVVKTLLEITDSTPLDKPYSTVAIRTLEQDTVTIRMDLTDVRLKEKLVPLVKRTPKPMAPIIVSNPFGPKPMLVLTIKGTQHETVPILIDLNKQDVVKILDKISAFTEKGSWVINLPGVSNDLIDIRINPHNAENKKMLVEISKMTEFIPAPITLHGGGILMVPVILKNNIAINIPLNTTDAYTIVALVSLIKEHAKTSNRSIDGIKFYLEDGNGNRILAIVDYSMPNVEEILLELGMRVVSPCSIRIKPSSGIEYLFVAVVPLFNGFLSVTIDLNSRKVMQLLEDVSDPLKTMKGISTIHLEFAQGAFEANIHRNNPNIHSTFVEMTKISPIQVCPFKLIPPGGLNPIFSIVTRIGTEMKLLIIDISGGRMSKTLTELNQASDEGLTSIEFIKYDGTRDKLNLNLSDYKVVSAIKDSYEEESLIYFTLRRDGNPLIIVKDNQYTLRLDANVPFVFNELVKLSADGKDPKTKTQLELKTKLGYSTFLYIDFKDVNVRKRLEELSFYTEILPVQLDKQTAYEALVICPVLVVPPGGRFPLVMIQHRNFVTYTFDINESSILKLLTNMVSIVTNEMITVEVPDNEGNSILIEFDMTESTYNKIRNIPRYPVISFEASSKKLLPVLVMKIKEQLVELDLANSDIVQILKTISRPSADAYKVQIPLPKGKIILYLHVEDVAKIIPLLSHTTDKTEATTEIDVSADIDFDTLTTVDDFPTVMATIFPPKTTSSTFPSPTPHKTVSSSISTGDLGLITSPNSTLPPLDPNTLTNVNNFPTVMATIFPPKTTSSTSSPTSHRTVSSSSIPTADLGRITSSNSTLPPLDPNTLTTVDDFPTVMATIFPPKTTSSTSPSPASHRTVSSSISTSDLGLITSPNSTLSPLDPNTLTTVAKFPAITDTLLPSANSSSTSPSPTSHTTVSSSIFTTFRTITPKTTTTPAPNHDIYWSSLILTNMLSYETYKYTFDLSDPKIVKRLKEYSLGVPNNNHVKSITLQLPEGPMILRVNLYDSEVFKLFRKLTILSTGREPEFLGIHRPHIWWNFTVFDHYHNAIKIELDVSNKNILTKIKSLSDMFFLGRPGTIVKGTALDGKEYHMLVDLSCGSTIINLRNMARESKGGKPKPLKALCPYRPEAGRDFLKFFIRPPGFGKKITIVLDINDPQVIQKLLELNKKFILGGTSYSLKIRTKKKLYKIKLDIAKVETLKALIELSKESSGTDPFETKLDEKLFQQIYSPNLITIEIRDGGEVIPVTLDVNDKYVVEILEKIQTHNPSRATVLKFVDSDGDDRELSLDINSRNVISILLAIGVPTFSPRESVRVRLITFIIIKKTHCYTAIKLDLSDRPTVILFLDMVRQYSPKFHRTVTIEVRDDSGQYMGVDVDFRNKEFIRGLKNLADTSSKHRIQSKDHPFVVFCFPSSTKGKTYEVLKFRMNKASLRYFKHLPVKKHCITITVTDASCRIRLYPGEKTFLARMARVPGVAYVQRRRSNPLVVVYLKTNKKITPIYLNLRDPETVNALAELHNSYAMSFGKRTLSIVRIYKAHGTTEYLLIHATNQKVLSTLSKLSIHLSNHYFVRQRLEKLVVFKIPTKQNTFINVRLNIADRAVVSALERLSDPKAIGKNVYTFKLKDAFGKKLNLTYDLSNPEIVSSLIKLSDKN